MLICQYIREIMRFSLLRKFIIRKGRKRKLITYAAWSYNSTYQNTLMNWMVCSRVLFPFFWRVEQFCLNKFEEMCLVFFQMLLQEFDHRSSVTLLNIDCSYMYMYKIEISLNAGFWTLHRTRLAISVLYMNIRCQYNGGYFCFL